MGGILRRTFLLGTAAIAGGVAFGYYRYATPYPNPLERELEEGEATFNAYVKITSDNTITIIAPRAEMGQGISTILAALVAEELDVTLEQVTVEHGPASAAYFNRAILEDGTPFPHFRRDLLSNSLRQSMAVLAKFVAIQATGGSTATRDGYVKMRQAGAAARETLKAAAARKTGMALADLKTANGHVIAGDRRIPYGDLPDMVYGTVRMNPRLVGVMKRFDAARALKVPGVLKVVDMSGPEDEAYGGGIGVIATNTWAAFKGAEAVEIEWDDAPYPPASAGIFKVLEDALAAGTFDQPYSIDNFRVSAIKADLAVPVGFWRSVGNSYNPFMSECFLDEIAVASKLDPVALMEDYPTAQKVVEKVAQMSNWSVPPADGRARGIAFCLSFGTWVAEVVEISRRDGDIRIENVWCAADAGEILDPAIFRAQMQSGIVFGLSSAMGQEITFEDGMARQKNFDTYDAMRINQCPTIEVALLENAEHMGGAGEPGTPPSIPALANAIFALTGKRIRTMPLSKEVRFA